MNAYDIGLAEAMVKVAETRAERRYRRAKAHVAKGHEQEKVRLQHKGMWIGGGGVTAAAMAHAIARHLKGKRPVPRYGIPQAALQAAGFLVGRHIGGRVAESRLRESQRREGHGHYAPFEKKSSDVRDQTAKMNRTQTWSTNRAVTKPVANKPKIINTPQPPKPQVEPSTTTPTQMPVVQQPEKTAARRPRLKRKSAEDNLGEPRTTWRGQKIREYRPGPENEPEPESWRGRDF